MLRRSFAMTAVLSACALLGSLAATGSGQAHSTGSGQARISNGQVTARAAGALAQTFRSIVAAEADVAWIGYAVPVKDRGRTMCCWSNGSSSFSGSMSSTDAPCCGSCRIEPAATASPGAATAATPSGPVRLEGSERMLVLFRVASRQVERIRTFSEDCEIDAGGKPVRWLEAVNPVDSVALLESMVRDEPARKSRITSGALAALAQHADASAGAAITRLARDHAAPAVRGEALFWMAQRDDAGAPDAIIAALERDPAAAVRKRAVFALSQLKNDAGIEPLIRVSRGHADAVVRGEAIFWLGQKAGRKAAGMITEAIEKDPETDVKRRAVFALSQLPKDEGVPLLIDVARKNTNPAVRKQAIFWLGQSRDPRAIEFFAEILK